MVRVHAHYCIDAVVAVCQVNGDATGAQIVAGGDHERHAGSLRPLHHLREIVGELTVV